MGNRSLKRASADTWKLANQQGLVIALVLLLLGLAGFWLVRGSDKAKEQIVTWVIFGVAPVAIVLFVAFLWNLARAPLQLDLERVSAGLGGVRVTRGTTHVEAPDFEPGDALEIEDTPKGVVVRHKRAKDAP